MTVVESPLSLVDWPIAELARLVGGSARFLSALEEEDEPAEVRLLRLERANVELAPLLFTPQAEPRRVIVEALRSIDQRAGLLHEVVAAFLRRPGERLSSAVVITLLELLVTTDFSDGQATAALAADRFAAAAQGRERGRMQAALVQLSGRAEGASPLFAMIARLRRSGGLSLEGGFAALRMLASWHADKLRLGIATLQADLNQESLTPATLQALLIDLVRRSSRESVLISLTGLDPRQYPTLSLAAFFHAQPPFRAFILVEYSDDMVLRGGSISNPDPDATMKDWLADADGPDTQSHQRLVFGWEDVTVDITDFLTADRASFWYRALLNATGRSAASSSRLQGVTGRPSIDIGLSPPPAASARPARATEAPKSLVSFFLQTTARKPDQPRVLN